MSDVKYVLEVQGIKLRFVKSGIFGRSEYVTRAVDGISFGIRPGEVFVLAGESGSGKSTVAKIILGALRADAGRVIFDGKEVRFREGDLQRIRARCQMVQQDPYDSINPRMTVSDIVAEPLEVHGVKDADERRRRVLAALEEVRLEPTAQIAAMHPHMLSGGQRQRVVLARAMATRPQVIIADEPVSMLDISVRAEVLALMRQLQKRHRISFLYITHDLATARHFGQRIAVMYSGKVVETGTTSQVLLHPRHPYTRALIDAISEPDPQNAHKTRCIRVKDAADSDPLHGCRFRMRCPLAADRCSQEPELARVGRSEVACFFPLD